MISLIKVAFDCVTSSSSYRGQKKWRMSFPFNFLTSSTLIFLGKGLYKQSISIERSKHHINRAIGSTQTSVPIAWCAWIDRCGRKEEVQAHLLFFWFFFYPCVPFFTCRQNRSVFCRCDTLWAFSCALHSLSLSLSDTFEAREYTNTEERERERERERENTCYVIPQNNSLWSHMWKIFFLFVGAFGRKIRFRNFQISIKEIRY